MAIIKPKWNYFSARVNLFSYSLHCLPCSEYTALPEIKNSSGLLLLGKLRLEDGLSPGS
jgi:hypothetical protein